MRSRVYVCGAQLIPSRPHEMGGVCSCQNVGSTSPTIILLEGGGSSIEGSCQLSLPWEERAQGVNTLTSLPSFPFIPCQTQLETRESGPGRSPPRAQGRAERLKVDLEEQLDSLWHNRVSQTCSRERENSDFRVIANVLMVWFTNVTWNTRKEGVKARGAGRGQTMEISLGILPYCPTWPT